HGYHALRVYRQLEMEAVIPDDARETIMAACRRYFGEPYAFMDRLSSAVSICPDVLRPLLRWLLRRLEDRKWIPGLNGLFCSELIALIYRDLGLKFVSW